MRRLSFSQLSWDDLASLVRLDERGIDRQSWGDLARGELTEIEERIIDRVIAGLQRIQPSLANEATVWSRAIFPLLFLAETERIVAQADVPLAARIGEVELTGCADGAFGTPIAGELRAPFLIVVEAKRGIEGYNPVAQLYGELLAAAFLNAKQSGRDAQRLYGSYTIGDDWTFVRADVEGIGAAQPTMVVTSSAELNEKLEAATIVKILKSIVARHAAEVAAR
jgi:hypothetical protein